MDEKIEDQSQIHTATGPIYFIGTTDTPAIPDEDGRECPQCKRKAWLKSRWCWYCHFDFDKYAIFITNRSKTALLSLVASTLMCFILGFLFCTAHKL